MQRYLHWIGWVFILGSVLFLTYSIHTAWHNLPNIQFDGLFWSIFSGSCFLISIGGLFLAWAWHKLLLVYGNQNLVFGKTWRIYSRSHIGKYIPGNIAQIAGRHLLGRREMISHRSLAASSVYEILGVLFASSTIGLIGILIWNFEESKTPLLIASITLISCLTFPLFIQKVGPSLPVINKIHLEQTDLASLVKHLLPIYFMYFIYILICGISFTGVAYALIPETSSLEIGPILTVYSLAYAIGLVVPGAPGGLGVREAVIVSLLGPIYGGATAIAIALVFRFSTVFGDALMFLAALIPQKHKP
jgi:uncharacterized membrane protein YbhN (UPF0104 family)